MTRYKNSRDINKSLVKSTTVVMCEEDIAIQFELVTISDNPVK